MDIKLLLEYTKDLRVLYVEDDDDLRNSTAELFENYFKHIDTAVNGIEGLVEYKRFANTKDAYDLIISDINMPGLNGIDMSKEIRKNNPHIQILLITAHNEIEYLQSAIEIGIANFITKPINMEKLNLAIYQTCQSISDHKFVIKHVDTMEKLALQLEEQNSELQEKNAELEKTLRMLDTMVYKSKLAQPKEENKIPAESVDAIDLQIEQFIKDDLCELKELHTEIDVAVISIINSNDVVPIEKILSISEGFSRYASTLAFYSFFSELASAMNGFAITLKDNPVPEDKEQVINTFMLLESFLFVLKKWNEDIESISEGELNFFDASIINDMKTITMMWTQADTDVELDEDEIEFF